MLVVLLLILCFAVRAYRLDRHSQLEALEKQQQLEKADVLEKTRQQDEEARLQREREAREATARKEAEDLMRQEIEEQVARDAEREMERERDEFERAQRELSEREENLKRAREAREAREVEQRQMRERITELGARVGVKSHEALLRLAGRHPPQTPRWLLQAEADGFNGHDPEYLGQLATQAEYVSTALDSEAVQMRLRRQVGMASPLTDGEVVDLFEWVEESADIIDDEAPGIAPYAIRQALARIVLERNPELTFQRLAVEFEGGVLMPAERLPPPNEPIPPHMEGWAKGEGADWAADSTGEWSQEEWAQSSADGGDALSDLGATHGGFTEDVPGDTGYIPHDQHDQHIAYDQQSLFSEETLEEDPPLDQPADLVGSTLRSLNRAVSEWGFLLTFSGTGGTSGPATHHEEWSAAESLHSSQSSPQPSPRRSAPVAAHPPPAMDLLAQLGAGFSAPPAARPRRESGQLDPRLEA